MHLPTRHVLNNLVFLYEMFKTMGCSLKLKQAGQAGTDKNVMEQSTYKQIIHSFLIYCGHSISVLKSTEFPS